MTINQLIKKLEKIRAVHGKRVHVVIDVRECKVNPSIFEEHSHWSAGVVDVEILPWGEGSERYRADGEERVKKVVSISL